MTELFLFTFKSVPIYFKMDPIYIYIFKLKNDCEDVSDWLHAFLMHAYDLPRNI